MRGYVHLAWPCMPGGVDENEEGLESEAWAQVDHLWPHVGLYLRDAVLRAAQALSAERGDSSFDVDVRALASLVASPDSISLKIAGHVARNRVTCAQHCDSKRVTSWF